MRIFITGGSGYIGPPTVAALNRDGHEVEALSRSRSSDETLRALGATPVRGSLADLDVLRAAAARADGVIHLGQDQSPNSATIDREAAAAMLQGVGRGPFIHTGGAWVYGDTHGLADETSPRNPPEVVAWREQNEQAVLATAQTGGRPVLVMPGLVYGDHDGLIETFFATPARDSGQPFKYIGDGENRWALVHRGDIAELYVLALTAPAGATYLGVGPVTPTARRVAEALAESSSRPGEIASITIDQARAAMGAIADGFALDQQFTNERASRELGWSPRFDDPLGEISRPAIPAGTSR
jgi:nucleoside-diphosphate-sugar epimerase